MAQMQQTGFGEQLAAAGYCLLIFDYRGWGASDSSVVTMASGRDVTPQPHMSQTAKVHPLQGILAPFSWVLDVSHALDFIEALPGIDPNRIGLLGSSVGGDIVAHVASRDSRVKCVVSQMGIQDLRGSDQLVCDSGLPFWTVAQIRSLSVQTARDGDFPVQLDVPDLIVTSMGHEPGSKVSTLINPDVRRWAPIEDAAAISVPILILDAGDEPNWNIREHGEKLSRRIADHGRTLCRYQTISGAGHVMATYSLMGISGTPESDVRGVAVDWFIQHLQFWAHLVAAVESGLVRKPSNLNTGHRPP